ncbi:MAG: 1,4-dihydroxy-2-naphthoate polyprenyltransferase [Tannerellaceae bacterium]|jgi:1,4-dihydroxy-2-naphthoate octaprenyltransferase|nr:1,4-dihydroxy-2-naphthoate polyprenyltransferase [Tannerellaceae bacterium]
MRLTKKQRADSELSQCLTEWGWKCHHPGIPTTEKREFVSPPSPNLSGTGRKEAFSFWLQAARPKTLTASVSPVLLGCALAYVDGLFRPGAAVLCLLVALLAQIACNFANDYFDFKKGADTADRLGPERAVACGRIAPRTMLAATFITLGLACLCGLGLLFYADWWLLFVGIAIAVCALAYSAGPYPLAYHGLGDVCVLLFYGVVPVCFTYYVQALSFSVLSFWLSLSVGLLSVNILVVNNYRDYEQDRAAGKRTSIVYFGRRFGRLLYLANGISAIVFTLPLLLFPANAQWIDLLYLAFFLLFLSTWRELTRLQGRALNRTLGRTARNVFFYTILLILAILFQ